MKNRYRIPIAILCVVVIIIIIFGWWWCWWRSCSGPVTTVLLVRHAEKAATPLDDPPLTPLGEDRARALAHVIAKAGISAIFTSDKLRTIQTAEPAETALGITHQAFAVDDTLGVAETIRTRHAGQTVLVVSHTTKVPEIIRNLGGPTLPNIDESEFDNLFILTTQNGRCVRLVQLQYGPPSPQ